MTELEISSKFKEDVHQKMRETLIGNIIITPPIDKDYWLFRVKLFKDQAVIAFPKFFTLGIGFALEEDWNTNLPYKNCTAEEICEHIWHNHKYEEITKEQTINAIKILQEACHNLDKISQEEEEIKGR